MFFGDINGCFRTDGKIEECPLFELRGSPCQVDNCKGIMIMSFKNKIWFKTCSICPTKADL